MQTRYDNEEDPVCWRPQHAGGFHMSKKAWRAAKARSARQYQRLLARRQEWNPQPTEE